MYIKKVDMRDLKALLIGIIFFPIRRLLKPRKKLWLFGSDQGLKYAQNSKYLFEFVVKNHPEIEAYWITRSLSVYNELNEKGIPVLDNISIKGAYYSLIAEQKVESTWFNDILYTFPNNRVAYLMHGMPIKKIYYDNIPKLSPPKSIIRDIKGILSDLFLYDFKLENSCFTPVTSPFFKELVVKAMRNNNVYVTGQPRTDAFLHLDGNVIRDKYGIDKKSFIITYMPTHRSYGRGEPSPHIFINNKEAIKFFKDNNIVIVWKQHINMLKNYKKLEADDCFKELSFDYSVDPQELLFVSDVLITDWSSCFIDYMLLQRPILFYQYDDYEKNDNDLYYGTEKLSKVGQISHDEKKLLKDIRMVCSNDRVRYDKEDWTIFNEYYDDKSCERSFYILQSIVGNG